MRPNFDNIAEELVYFIEWTVGTELGIFPPQVSLPEN